MDYILMTQSHVSQVAQLEAQCFSMPWSENAISGELTNPLALWVVAVEDGTVAGYIGSQSVMGEADMMNLAVHPDYRRRGIGRALVQTLVSMLWSKGVTSLALEVRASNESAIALYTQLGFTQVGRRPNYYKNPREDALILRMEWEV